MDYHVEFDKRLYSVPYQLVGETVELAATQHTVTIYHRGKIVATHRRLHGPERQSTNPNHMPATHRAYAARNPEDMAVEASKTGPFAEKWVRSVFEACAHPEQGYRIVAGLFRLLKRYEPEQIDRACERAVAYGAFSYRSLESILSRGLQKLGSTIPEHSPIPDHENVRGPLYYAVKGGSFQ